MTAEDDFGKQRGQKTIRRGVILFITIVCFNVTPHENMRVCDFPLWLLSRKSLEELLVPRAPVQKVSLPAHL